MGVGYSVSPLHRIKYPDFEASSRPATPGESPLADRLGFRARVMEGPMRYHALSQEDITTWRARISAKYRSQLGEDLAWDENSTFEVDEDAFTSGDMLLRYTAAKLDQLGPDAARALVHTSRPEAAELDRVFAEANRGGFAGRFPQLLLGVRYWLPFERDLVIEEPDWFGHPARYGSAPRLAEELAAVREFISAVDGAATAWSAQRDRMPDDVLAAAWQASDTVSRLCRAAVDQRLPLWTTG